MKIVAFDLDDVICFRDKKYESLGIKKYEYCQPIESNIKLINECYLSGYYIKIYTARGMNTLNNNYSEIISKLFDLTTSHLKQWNVNYHELIFGKIHYDLLIDDKAKNINDLSSIKDIKEFLGE